MKALGIILQAVSILLFATSSPAQTKVPDSTGKTCEQFLKDFYAWYLPIAQAEIERHVQPLDLTVRANPAVLSREIISGIEAVDAEAKKSGDAGLDFDPVLNSQDPGGPGDPPYIVRDVKVEGKICRADVYYQSTDGKTEKIVIPELQAQNNRWIFTNFHYPNFPKDPNSNLVTIIKNYLRDSKMPQN